MHNLDTVFLETYEQISDLYNKAKSKDRNIDTNILRLMDNIVELANDMDFDATVGYHNSTMHSPLIIPSLGIHIEYMPDGENVISRLVTDILKGKYRFGGYTSNLSNLLLSYTHRHLYMYNTSVDFKIETLTSSNAPQNNALNTVVVERTASHWFHAHLEAWECAVTVREEVNPDFVDYEVFNEKDGMITSRIYLQKS